MSNEQKCKACLAEYAARVIRADQVKPTRAKGLCTTHYRRLMRNGTTDRVQAKLGPTVELTVRLPVAMIKVLRRDAKLEKCSVADLVRKAIGAS